MNNYELSLWSHSDDFIRLLKGSSEFEGQAYNVSFVKNINGEEKLSFSLPLYIFNFDSNSFIKNPAWMLIKNEFKIRLIRNKKQEDESIHDFVIKSFTESRDGDQKIISVECKAYFIFELSRVGYTASFSEETIRINDFPNIDYWLTKALVHSGNFSSDIVPLYDSQYEYYIGDYCRIGTNVYRSLSGSADTPNIGNSPDIPETVYWSLIQGENNSGWTYDKTVINEDDNVVDFIKVGHYDLLTSYSLGAHVYSEEYRAIFESLIDNNLGNSLQNFEYWKEISKNTEWEEVRKTDEFGTEIDIEKIRILKIEKSNVFNLIQQIAEKFSVWMYFQYSYDIAYKTIGRKVIYKSEIEIEAPFSIKYGINSKEISRQIASENIVTKLYVAPVESEFEDSGLLAISNASENYIMEDFIYNFDYFKTAGLMTSYQYDTFEIFKSNLRNINSDYMPIALKSIEVDNQLNILIAEQTFINNEKTAALDILDEINVELEQYEDTYYDFTDHYFIVNVDDLGRYYADLSYKKGVNSIQSVKNNSNENIETSGTDTTFTIVTNSDSPTFIDKIIFSKNPNSNDSNAKIVKISFTAHPFNYTYSLQLKYSDKVDSINSRLVTINQSISDLTTIKNNYLLEKTLNRNIRSKLIADFEREVSVLIKEGNWTDTSYQLVKESEVIYNTPITFENPQTVTGFILINDLNNIDFSSIHVWKSDLSIEFYPYLDYSLEYGKNSFGTKGLVFKIKEDSRLLDELGIEVRYTTLSGELKTYVISKDTQLTIYTRTIIISKQNIISSTLSIFPGSLEGGQLVLNTDFIKDISINTSGTKFILKTTQDAKHMDQYYAIKYDVNNTVGFFYRDALKVLERSAEPEITYSINAIDLSSLQDYKEYNPVVGQKVAIFDDDLNLYNVYGFVSEINYNLDLPEETTISISNYKDNFDDLFQRIVASSEQLNLRGDSYERVATAIGPRNIISSTVLQNSFSENSIVLSTGSNNSVVWGSDGITLIDRSTTNSTTGQIKLIGNGIFLSNSVDNYGNRIWSSGITPNGINASKITTGSINTQNITIVNGLNQRFLWNHEGLFAYSLFTSGLTDFNTYIQFNDEGLLFQRNIGTNLEPNIIRELSLTWDGLTIGAQNDSVKITSQYGLQVFDSTKNERVQIGRLYDGETATDKFGIRLKNNAGITSLETDTDGRLWLKDLLLIGQDSSQVGISADFSSTSSAQTIVIARDVTTEVGSNLLIMDNYSGIVPRMLIRDNINIPEGTTVLSVTNDGIIISNNATGSATIQTTFITNSHVRIWAGASYEDRLSAKFRIHEDGTLFASQAFITGTINATGGNFHDNIYVGSTQDKRIIIYGDEFGSYIQSDNYQPNISGWIINSNGYAEFGDISVRGTLKSTVFVYDEINAQGGSLMITASGALYENILINPVSYVLYDEFTTYMLYDTVLFENQLYRSRIDNNTQPLTDSLSWFPYFIHKDVKIKRQYNEPPLFRVADILKIRTHNESGDVYEVWFKILSDEEMLIYDEDEDDDPPVGQESSITPYQNYIEYEAIILNTLQITSEIMIPSGTAIVNYKKKDNGFILLKADDINYVEGPFIDILINNTDSVQQEGSQSRMVRLGDLNPLKSNPIFGNRINGYGLYAENAYLTGTVALPNAGMTNEGTAGSSVRIWAGTDISNKENAPFQVLQDGTLILADNSGVDQMIFDPLEGKITFSESTIVKWTSQIEGSPVDQYMSFNDDGLNITQIGNSYSLILDNDSIDLVKTVGEIKTTGTSIRFDTILTTSVQVTNDIGFENFLIEDYTNSLGKKYLLYRIRS